MTRARHLPRHAPRPGARYVPLVTRASLAADLADARDREALMDEAPTAVLSFGEPPTTPLTQPSTAPDRPPRWRRIPWGEVACAVVLLAGLVCWVLPGWAAW